MIYVIDNNESYSEHTIYFVKDTHTKDEIKPLVDFQYHSIVGIFNENTPDFFWEGDFSTLEEYGCSVLTKFQHSRENVFVNVFVDVSDSIIRLFSLEFFQKRIEYFKSTLGSLDYRRHLEALAQRREKL